MRALPTKSRHIIILRKLSVNILPHMKRRTFLSTAPLSLLGLGLPVGAAASLGGQKPGIRQWLLDLARAVPAKRAAAFFWPSGLREQIDISNAFLAARGYLAEEAGAFFSVGQTHCFYPLALRRSQAGLLDLLVPVFTRDAAGDWQQVLVLTGYQIEALARATAVLSAAELPVAGLLLPVRRVAGEAGSYESRLGRVKMITRMQQGQAQTAITVRHGGAVVYDAVFQSLHTLTTQSRIA